MQAEGDSTAERAEQWQFLMFEVDAACAVCGEPLRIGQAVGYIRGRLLHARCYREPPEPERAASGPR